MVASLAITGPLLGALAFGAASLGIATWTARKFVTYTGAMAAISVYN